jgi:hypothetical protein
MKQPALRSVPKLVERYELDFNGWYADSAEGFLSRYVYEDDPERAAKDLAAATQFLLSKDALSAA